MSISRLKLLGYLIITTTILSVAMWMSPERGKFLPFKGINQAVTQNRPNTQQQQRIALVIGNANYTVGKLKTPLNDATDMANALKELGFEVILLKDSSKRQMDDALDQFTTRINQGYVGLFYYAGHGMEVEGENYLIPVNAQIKYEKDVEYESMPLGKILGRMEDSGNRINIVILDACRDNPFRKFWRSSSRGLTAPSQATSGTLIAFATAPGKVASDGTGRNGLFTSYLLKYIKTPNMEVDSMLQKVRSDVAQNTNNYQVPWTSSSLIGEFAFNQKTETTPPIVTSSPVPNPSPSIAVVPTPKPTPSPPPVTSSPVPKPSPSIAVVPTPKPTPSPSPVTGSPVPKPSPSIAAVPTPKPNPSPVLKPGTTLISRSTGVNYTRLRDLLAAGEWKEADYETNRAMLQAAKREGNGSFYPGEIKTFSCEDLRMINQLWLSASKGKFGISVQKEIYESLGGTREYNQGVWNKFGDRVGWRKGGSWLWYDELTYSDQAPKGHLPGRIRFFLFAFIGGYEPIYSSFRAKACNL
ncbi:peptidase C14 caspase catalytic subunit p20 [Microcystis viridis NIES-102]|uniref:Peptidase C14 caspase catalytic subunit p20 n=1 Tax=Microcystis viridis NIES-102 TaxID=213615 RepID=A0A3G9JIA3_MICVR|nr:caspase family protein [Microcystis viridis]BBH40253.1 peptidase C14 caspase catalytic subunit p20 [Microcystis viridis NIES-102]